MSLFAFSQDDFEAWKKAQQQQFQQFKDKNDKAFMDFLEKDWKAFNAFRGMKRDETPKPRKVPVVKPESLPRKPIPRLKTEKPKPIKEVVRPKPAPVKKPKTVSLPPVPQPTTVKKEETIKFDFFGSEVVLPVDKQFKSFSVAKVDKEHLTEAWRFWSNSSYEKTLNSMVGYSKKYRMNDWAYVLMIHDAAAALYDGENEINLFMWFFLSKSGYRSKMGFYENKTYLLLPADQMVYGITYFTFDNVKYFAFGYNQLPPNVTTLYTYDGDYPGAKFGINFNIGYFPQKPSAADKKNLAFKYNGQEYRFQVVKDKARVRFLKYYPQTDMDVYFRAPMEDYQDKQLFEALTPLIKGKSQTEAVNILLRFVQTAFAYKTDPEQFGREKPLFIEESLYYPYNDCEDRSVLFAYLVRNLLGLEVVGLDYPGHIATAVKFTVPVNGDKISFNGKEYVICDPTYINANIGMCMPQYKNVAPKVILF